MICLSSGTKACSECGEVKPLSEFNKHSSQPDGRQLRCRSCFSRYNRARYIARRDEFRSAIYAYREANPEAVLKSRLSSCRKNPTHTNAYRVVEAALSAQAIKRPVVCPGCGKHESVSRIEAHHHDYTKPLDVLWLCHRCHHAVHASIRRYATV